MAGKGHYIPAKAVNEQLVELGVDSQLVDFFDFLHLKHFGQLNQWIWRRMLSHSSLEKTFFHKLDSSKGGVAFITNLCYVLSRHRLKKYRSKKHRLRNRLRKKLLPPKRRRKKHLKQLRKNRPENRSARNARVRQRIPLP